MWEPASESGRHTCPGRGDVLQIMREAAAAISRHVFWPRSSVRSGGQSWDSCGFRHTDTGWNTGFYRPIVLLLGLPGSHTQAALFMSHSSASYPSQVPKSQFIIRNGQTEV